MGSCKQKQPHQQATRAGDSHVHFFDTVASLIRYEYTQETRDHHVNINLLSQQHLEGAWQFLGMKQLRLAMPCHVHAEL